MESLKEIITMLKENYEKRIDMLEESVKVLFSKVNETSLNHATMVVKIDNLVSDMTSIKQSLQKLADKAGQRWDNIVSSTIKTIVALIVGFAISKVFGG